jgi:putative membrane protein
MEFAHGGWPHFHWFWIVPCLFMILMFVCAAFSIRRACARRYAPGNPAGWRLFGCHPSRQGPMENGWSEAAHQILDRRYASGEITKEQYQQMKRDIETK